MAVGLAVYAIAQGVAALAGGFAGAKAAKEVQKENEEVLKYTTRRNVERLQAQEEQLVGRQKASYAAAGVRVGSGSAKLIQDETRAEFSRAQEALTHLYRRQVRGSQAQAQGVQTASIIGGVSGAASAGLDFWAANPFGKKLPNTPTAKGGGGGGNKWSQQSDLGPAT